MLRVRPLPFATSMLAVLVALGCAPRLPLADSSPAATAALAQEINAMLARSATAWNRGDLDAFMSDYLPGQGTTFVTSRGILRGPEEIRGAYAARFAPGAQRDSLRFEGLEVHPLAPGVVHVIAFYVLSRGDSTTARGPTSLVMRHVGGRWRIAHDHSS